MGAETKQARYTLDGEPVESLDEFMMSNTFDEETTGLILSLAPGEEMLLGGGAGAEFRLRCEAVLP